MIIISESVLLLGDAYECRHTRYAWALPFVQEMVQIQRDRGNILAEMPSCHIAAVITRKMPHYAVP